MSRSPFDAAMAQMHRAMNSTPEELEAFLRVAVESSEANTYVRDLRAEAAGLRAKVARVEELVTAWENGYLWSAQLADRLRDVLSGATPSGSTDSDTAATERQGEAEGAGDGV